MTSTRPILKMSQIGQIPYIHAWSLQTTTKDASTTCSISDTSCFFAGLISVWLPTLLTRFRLSSAQLSPKSSLNLKTVSRGFKGSMEMTTSKRKINQQLIHLQVTLSHRKLTWTSQVSDRTTLMCIWGTSPMKTKYKEKLTNLSSEQSGCLSYTGLKCTKKA
jgi:dynactin complex subunit